MLKFQTWYAITWLVAILLYGFGWSSLNGDLYTPLLVFFAITVFFSFAVSAISPKVAVNKLIWDGKRRPAITAGIALGFAADWAYSGTMPIMNEYHGATGIVDVDMTIGIPVFHVLLTAVAIYYAMYVAYLFLSDPSKKGYLYEFLILVALLLLNNSRGYVAFCLIALLLMYVAFTVKGIKETKVRTIIVAVCLGFLVILFVSVMGNLRNGYAWDDCSYIERIGRYTNYPEGLTKHFMWIYTYATSPLSNLNLNCLANNESTNLIALLMSFVPESFSKWYTSTAVQPLYVVSYLNAATAFTPFACSYGMLGVCVSFVGLFAYYSVVAYFLKRCRVLETFGNALLSFCILSTIFFNVFTTSAICYIPLFLLLSSVWLKRRAREGVVRLEPVERRSGLEVRHD